jgi:D-tyrosyl-tRNA(Tyr) deacylase
MRAVLQRVSKASVKIDNQIFSETGPGIVVLIGIEEADSLEDIDWLCNKIIQLRIFDDKNGVMNLPITETGGDILAVSQFTLHAKTKKGNRPSYIKAAKPDIAIPLYKNFVAMLSQLLGKEVKTGEFGAMMQVEIINNGPVTIILDTKNKE